MQPQLFQTTSRKLEEFLYLHDIRFVDTYLNEDALHVWVYKLTPYVQHVIDEYRQIIARRNARASKEV